MRRQSRAAHPSESRFFSLQLVMTLVLCLCILSCVLFFHALTCPLSSPVYFPMFPLAPSVYCFVPFMVCAPPLRYLTCWSTSPVPRLVISVCVFSLCVPLTPCLVIVLVSFCLRPCSHSCACLFLVPPLFICYFASCLRFVCFCFSCSALQ